MKYKVTRRFYLMNAGKWFQPGEIVSDSDEVFQYLRDLPDLLIPVEEKIEIQEEGEKKDEKGRKKKG